METSDESETKKHKSVEATNENEPDAKKIKLNPTEVMTDTSDKPTESTTVKIEPSENLPDTSSSNGCDQKQDTEQNTTEVEPTHAVKSENVKNDDKTTESSQSKEKADLLEYRVREPSVGITEYISNYEGFQGVIKQRFSDFIVNEISKDGRVIHLTNTDPPTEDHIQPTVIDIKPGLLSVDEIKQLEELQKTTVEENRCVLISVGEDKDHRSKIHRAIEDGFPGLQSTTITKFNERFIEASIKKHKGSGLRYWPRGRGDYCKFVLYKEAKDTMDAIGIVSNKLRLKGSLFAYAGTKDKRSKSSQEVTAYKVPAEKLIQVNKLMRNIICGNFSYTDRKLALGQLQGNRFTIVLRSVTGTADQIEDGMASLRDIGFINYYGMQRFGVYNIPTHYIGRALLRCDWKEAVELILKPRPGEDQLVNQCREEWWKTRDHNEAFLKFPKKANIEKKILQSLSYNGKDYMAAIQKIPRYTRLMYVHAYQSYIWNTVASHRVKEHGLTPIIGDLVIPHKAYISTETEVEAEGTEQGIERDDSKTVKPILVDSTNIGDFTIYDVVLPKPGYAVIYPGNDIETLYKDLMAKDQLNYKNMKTKYKDYSLPGDYRHIVVKPQDVEWRTFRYNDVNISLTMSDQNVLNKDPEPKDVEDGKSLALRLGMTLPSSCYATMALRELLKIDTSSTYQTSLNVT